VAVGPGSDERTVSFQSKVLSTLDFSQPQPGLPPPHPAPLSAGTCGFALGSIAAVAPDLGQNGFFSFVRRGGQASQRHSARGAAFAILASNSSGTRSFFFPFPSFPFLAPPRHFGGSSPRARRASFSRSLNVGRQGPTSANPRRHRSRLVRRLFLPFFQRVLSRS
jgi:hypothetical protein